MKQIAKQFKIPISRWKSSRLYQASKRSNNSIVEFDPERDILLQNYSFDMEWQPWLTTLFQDFYRMGQLVVPDECKGSDLLLALEYFGILYSPGQLVFATYSVYQQVRCWSNYLSHRTALVDWVAERVQQTQASAKDPKDLAEKVLFFVTVRDPAEVVVAGGQRLQCLGCEGQTQDPSCDMVYHLFNTSNENRVAQSLRDDFCAYMERLFVDEIRATIGIKMVDVSAKGNISRCLRAILKIEFVLSHEDEEGEPSDPTWHEEHNDSSTQTPRTPKNGEDKSAQRDKVHPLGSKSTGSPIEVSHDIYEFPKSDKNRPLAVDRSPSTTPRRKPMLPTDPSRHWIINPVFEDRINGWNAPFEIIDPEQLESQTVASALTGPVFPSDDMFAMDAAIVQAEAVRNEWVQGSLLVRDISNQMRVLLDMEDIKEEQDAIESQERKNLVEPHVLRSNDSACQAWDWINTMCQGFPSVWDETSLSDSGPLVFPTSQLDQEQGAGAESPTVGLLNKQPSSSRLRKIRGGLTSPTALTAQRSRTRSLGFKLESPPEDSQLIVEAAQNCPTLMTERLKKLDTVERMKKYNGEVEPKKQEMPTVEEEVKECDASESSPKVDTLDDSFRVVSREGHRVCLGALFCRFRGPETEEKTNPHIRLQN